MTKEEKQLLLKDLCARLPYDVKVKSSRRQIVVTLSLDIMTDFHLGCTVKPYLRPMSSMTEEEKKKWFDAINYYDKTGNPYLTHIDSYDWLNEHHFDYRGLIPMGLALEAKDGMYKTE